MTSYKPGYLIEFLGGTGQGSCHVFHKLCQRFGEPAALCTQVIDSDRIDAKACPAHSSVEIAMQPDELDAMRANIEIYGPAGTIINQDFARFLHREKVQDGSRARRQLTQFFVSFHLRKIVVALRALVQKLMSEGITHIQPILAGSTGGGCGSPLAPLLALILHDERTRFDILAGYEKPVLFRPIVFGVDPYANADRNNAIQQMLIYANSFGYRHEMGYLLAQDIVAEVYLTGMANSQGTVLTSIDQAHRQLGTQIYWYLKHAALIKSIKANHSPTTYAGVDTPEHIYAIPADVHPSLS